MFDPQDKTRRTPPIRFAQSMVRWFFRMTMLFFRLRVYGIKHYPRNGPMLVCSNHQSNLDPLILGCACPRPVNYLAKKGLFKTRALGWFLTWNDAIAIDREGSLGGIKETLKRLKKKESVLMFPEGTRSTDGELNPIKRGFCALVRKSKVPIMPVGLDGAWDALPPHASVPNFGATIQVVFGEPIQPEEFLDLSDDELTDLLEFRIRACFQKARQLKASCKTGLSGS
jgi:1-acyl-sn-glycerol-3-phosphate acyltransferase